MEINKMIMIARKQNQLYVMSSDDMFDSLLD